MINQKSGKIINIASLLSFSGGITVPSYAASKGGVAQLTKALANEWAKYNIQVNGVGPGYIATSQTAPIRVDGHPFNDLVMTRTPAGRWGEPEDVGNAAAFLCSDLASGITGDILNLNGNSELLKLLEIVQSNNESIKFALDRIVSITESIKSF